MRKVIFSRKGFDSSAGGVPNIIFPNGTWYMIPIPSKESPTSYSDLRFSYEGDPIQKILNDLTGQTITIKGHKHFCDFFDPKFKCHVDPMVIRSSDFTGIAFGQVGASAAHLERQEVGEGDVFLFFSWFRKMIKKNGKWTYSDEYPDVHVIWGAMEVGEVVKINENTKAKVIKNYRFLEENKHPHLCMSENPNIIFLSRKWKVFRFNESLILTNLDPYKSRSVWKLPVIFSQPQAFSYIKDENFRAAADYVIVEIPGRGQEFVLDLEKVDFDQRGKIAEYVKRLCDF